jgi:hypothetical protein
MKGNEMNKKTEHQGAAENGSISVHIFDQSSGFVLRNALVALYYYDEGKGDTGKDSTSQNDNVGDNTGHNTGDNDNVGDNTACKLFATQRTDNQGYAEFFDVPEGKYLVVNQHLPRQDYGCRNRPNTQIARVHCGAAVRIAFNLCLHLKTSLTVINAECQAQPCQPPRVGDVAWLAFELNHSDDLRMQVPPGMRRVADAPTTFSTTLQAAGQFRWQSAISFPLLPDALAKSAQLAAVGDLIGGGGPGEMLINGEEEVVERPPIPISGNVGVSMVRSGTTPTADLSLWVVIRNSAEAMSFENYQAFMDFLIFKQGPGPGLGGANRDNGADVFEDNRFAKKEHLYQNLQKDRTLPFSDAESYRVLKAATEAFVMVNCGVFTKPQAFDQTQDEAYLNRRDIPAPSHDLRDVFNNDYLEDVGGGSSDRTLPYLALVRRKLPDVPISSLENLRNPEAYVNLVQNRLQNPCMLELIWSYWQEEGMLVQTMNAITRRFQNVRSPHANDPLSNLEIDPLRPLNNVIWGYTQDEQRRLTVARRNYEYDHHYGLRLEGNAVKNFRPADTRSKFLEAFHHLLRTCTMFYRQDDNTTVKADAFPVLNALKEIHLILSQGAHNQYGDLPSTARVEMLMQQWILSRPEFREFLPTRAMVAYPEPWMDRVDAMKKLQGWTDTSVLHFRSLAMFGEQVLLSIRFGAWSDVYEPTQAFNWARFWRPQIQGYIHAYRSATGVDLANEAAGAKVDATMPSVLLQKRLSLQQRNVAA